jgi:hypothetical protein
MATDSRDFTGNKTRRFEAAKTKDQVIPWSTVLFKKLIFVQVAFYGSRRFIHNSQTLVPILSQINPINIPSSFFKINFNIILGSAPGSPKWFLSFTFCSQIIQPRRILTGHVACLVEVKNASKILVWKPGGERLLWRLGIDGRIILK